MPSGVASHPKGYAQYSSLGAVIKLSDAPTAGVVRPDGAIVAEIIAELQDVRWRDDGIAPTSAVGMPIKKDTPYQYAGDLDKLQIIEQAGGGRINVAYYGI